MYNCLTVYLLSMHLNVYLLNPYDLPNFQRCIQLTDEGKWKVESCENKAKFICEHDIKPVDGLFGNSAGSLDGSSSSGDVDRNERQRDFETLRPQADHEDICGRRFVRQSRIVGGQVASYGEWPWQVCTYLVPSNHISACWN